MSLRDNMNLNSLKCISIGKEYTWTSKDVNGTYDRIEITPYITFLNHICRSNDPILDIGEDYRTDRFYIGDIQSKLLKNCGRTVNEEIRRLIYDHIKNNELFSEDKFIQKFTKKLSERTNENKMYDRYEEN
jgi:peptide methionine sulfoxide reductase MsrA